MKLAFTFLMCLLSTAIPGCGDRIVDGEYRGEALLQLRGSMVVRADGVGTAADTELARSLQTLRVALFWSQHATQIDGTAVSLVEQDVVTDADFPVLYELSVFRPPPAAILTDAPDGKGRYAVALVMAYLDSDGDGRWSPGGDRLVGSAPNRAIIYTESGASSPFFGDLGPGYHRLQTADPERPCFAQAHEHFHGDGEDELVIYLDPERPTGGIVDVDCDGHSREWDICPPPEELALPCQESRKLGPLAWQCGTCGVAPLSAVCPAPAAVATGCTEESLDPLVCAYCPTMPNPELSCEETFNQCRMDRPGPVCDARFALCNEALANTVDCLDYTDRCFESGGFQANCLGWFADCYEQIAGQPAPAGPTCRSYGDVCLEVRNDDAECRTRFEACAQSL